MAKIQSLKLYRDIIDALSGTNQDYTSGSISRAVLLLSIPMVLEMVMESVFAIVDIYFVSKLGADAVSIVGITESLLTIIYAIAHGISMATVAIISRRIGEKREKEASAAAAQAMLLGLGISIIITFIGIFYSKNLLMLMGASAETIASGGNYTTISLTSNLIIMLLFINNSIFRSSGDASLSLRVLVIGNFINIILDPCLIFGIGPIPALGIDGAAVATATGRGIAVLYQLYLMFYKGRRIKINIQHFKPDLELLKQIVKLSIGGFGQSIIATSSWIGLMRIVSLYGSSAVAGYTIAIRIVMFCLLPSWGLSNAAATLTGQNLGAKKIDRVIKSVKITGWINVLVLGILGLFIAIFSNYFIQLFISDADVINNGSTALRIISLGFASYALGMVIMQAINGAGDTTSPTWINFVCFWLIEIPLAYVLAVQLGFKENGVYYSILVAETILTCTGLVIFRRGKWKEKTV